MSSQINGRATRTINRLAGSVFAFLVAVAVIDVSSLRADEFDDAEIFPTACGSGELTECGTVAIESCDWDISFNFSPSSSSFGFHVSRTNCRTIGTKAIYKDLPKGSLNVGTSCNLSSLNGMPINTNCM
jgi:hypothetical protein